MVAGMEPPNNEDRSTETTLYADGPIFPKVKMTYLNSYICSTKDQRNFAMTSTSLERSKKMQSFAPMMDVCKFVQQKLFAEEFLEKVDERDKTFLSRKKTITIHASSHRTKLCIFASAMGICDVDGEQAWIRDATLF